MVAIMKFGTISVMATCIVLYDLPILEDYLHYMRCLDRYAFLKTYFLSMFWKSLKPTNAWEESAERIEKFIAIARAYLFEVVIAIIVVVAIRQFIGAFRQWNPFSSKLEQRRARSLLQSFMNEANSNE